MAERKKKSYMEEAKELASDAMNWMNVFAQGVNMVADSRVAQGVMKSGFGKGLSVVAGLPAQAAITVGEGAYIAGKQDAQEDARKHFVDVRDNGSLPYQMVNAVANMPQMFAGEAGDRELRDGEVEKKRLRQLNLDAEEMMRRSEAHWKAKGGYDNGPNDWTGTVPNVPQPPTIEEETRMMVKRLLNGESEPFAEGREGFRLYAGQGGKKERKLEFLDGVGPKISPKLAKNP